MERHYLILSEGAYSDYSPEYFVGERKITQEEFDAKGREIGDRVLREFQEAPERPHVCQKYCYHSSFSPAPTTEKYNAETGNKLLPYPSASDWMILMREWITEQGYEPLPENIPEINTSYSEFPFNKP